MTTSLRSLVLGASCALVLGACSTDTTGPGLQLSPRLNRDVAVVAGQAASEDLAAMYQAAAAVTPSPAFSVEATGGEALSRGDCPFNEGSGRFECPPVTEGGLTITRSYALFDASGKPMSEFDKIKTASVNTQSTTVGTITHENGSATVNRSRNMTVSGLQGNEPWRTWDGSAGGTVSRSRHNDAGESRTYNLAESTVISGVRVPFPREEDSYPIQGSISRNMTVTVVGGPRDGETRERSVVITFNGSRFVTITVNGESFKYDLKERKIVD